MADVAITESKVRSHGGLWKEVGSFTAPSSGTFTVRTKLGRLVYFTLVGDDATDNNIELYWNSDTQSATEDDNGVVHVETGYTADKIYRYQAIGFG